MKTLTWDDVTPERLYLRRQFILGLGALAGGALLAACAGTGGRSGDGSTPDTTPSHASSDTDELGNALTPFESIAGYTNYYEFSFSKTAPARMAAALVTEPWSVIVDGLVANPKTYTLEALRAIPQEERIYRLRCVEAWSMVIPWVGFPLSRILDEVQPTATARFVRFESLADAKQMPGVSARDRSWPYVEGLRLDEAQHPLTILATGLYGKQLLPQNGAPVRLVVPWKYGFKDAKAIVRITLVAEMPETYWAKANPREYGFYANVNPEVPHPRWSQATEREIGGVGQRATMMFNGYDVGALYQDLDLTVNF
jgi:sulfoxide reductase catalytic subunit YedY